MRSKPMDHLGRLALLAAGAVLVSGCYSYTEVERPSPGSMVRVRVPVQSPVSGRARPAGTASLEGRLLTAGDTLALAARTRTDFGPYRQLVHVDTVRVPREALVSLEVQAFSTGRTVVLGAAIAGAAVAAAVLVFGGDVGGEPRPPTIPPQPALLGVLRFTLPGGGSR